MTGVATPFTSYTIPPNAPEPVAEAWRELNRIGILYDDASDALKDAGQALVAPFRVPRLSCTPRSGDQ